MRSTFRLTFVVLVAIGSLASAASASTTVSLRGGLSVANVSGRSDVLEPESKQGFTGQFALAFPLARGFSVAPEVGYAMRGFSLGESEVTDFVGMPRGRMESLLATDMVTLALPVTTAFPAAGRLRLHVLTGPQLEIEYRERLVNRGVIEGEIESEALKGNGFAWLFGAGVGFAAGPGEWSLHARYVHGLTQMTDDESLFDTHTRAFEFVTGYSFGL